MMKNTKRQLLKVSNMEISIVGSGKDLNDATAKIFKQIHQQVYAEIDVPIIQMETTEVYFDEITTNSKKMEVLSFKEKKTVTVKARVNLSIKYLDIKKEDEV